MTTTHDTLRAVAGDFYDTLTGRLGTDRLDALVAALDEITERYDDGEMAATSEHWNGALMLAYGDETLESLAQARVAAQRAYEQAHEQVLGAMIYAARVEGVPEAQIARVTGMSRTTVRKELGK